MEEGNLGEVPDVTDALDVDLQDRELRDEIRLVADLMVAGATASGHLCQDAIDRILLD